MQKPLSEQVIVITGATSGIGLATARHAAGQGARVVLAARSEGVLQDVVREISDAGGDALGVPTDVGVRAQVEALAQAAITRHGRIDTWVNNAGVSLWGRLDQVSEEDMRKLFETNLWGVVNGSLAALPHLRESRGTLINLGSIASEVAFPVQGIYAASKHAVKGFTDALRTELLHDRAGVTVTLVKPASIGTPLTRHARNITGRAARLPPPVYAPGEVARVILRAAVHPTREVYVGGAGPMLGAMAALAPGLSDKLGASAVFSAQLGQPEAPQPGNLHAPLSEAQEDGEQVGWPSLYSRAANGPAAPVLALGLAAAAAILLTQRRHRRH